MKIQVVTYKTTEYGREIERNDTGQSLRATLKAAGIDGVTGEWYSERNGVQISTLFPFKGIQLRVGKEMRRVMVKNGEIDEVALRDKLAEMEAVAKQVSEEGVKAREAWETKDARELALAGEAGLPIDLFPHEAPNGTYRLDLRGLTRDQVLAIGRVLRKED